MYNLLKKSTDLTTSIKNKIVAIQIARQWIEGFTNIRDTNWILYSSDYEDCWNNLNYKPDCIWDTTSTYDIKQNWNYKIYLSSDKRWDLKEAPAMTLNYSNNTYKTFFRVWLDSNWIYTQTWTTTNLVPLYTRQINVTYNWWVTSSQTMIVKSIVQWLDWTSTQPHKIELEQTLTNWKSKK